MVSGLLRIALALIVVVHHLSRLGVGKACVFVFFALSGYWVARMWEDKYRHGAAPWRTFVLARFFRIWPMFVVMNVIGLGAFALLGRPVEWPCGDADPPLACAHAVLANTLMLGYTTTPAQANAPAWSLDIELQFYLVAPFLAALLRSSIGLAAALATLPLALLAIHAVPETMPQFLPFFVAGMLAALGRWRIGAASFRCSLVATAALLLWSFGTSTGRQIVITGASPGPLAAYNDAYNALIAAVAIPAALYLAGRERDARGAALGDLAFLIYIVHWIPVSVVSVLWGRLPAVERLPYAAGAVAATVVAAAVLWWSVDRPLEGWRRRLTKPGRRRHGAPPLIQPQR